MPRYKYCRMKLELFPDDAIEEYNLRDKVEPDGYVYAEIRKCMHGLPQAGLRAQDLLAKRLEKHSYKQSKVTPRCGCTSGSPSNVPSSSTTSV